MKKVSDIQKAKLRFANKYATHAPSYYGVLASVQRGRLFTPGENTQPIRSFWQEQLEELTRKYKDAQQSETTFINDIESLKSVMNERFPESFHNGFGNFEDGFRIAHAQKSLSICLKHMWCRGQLNYTPPVCPIDRIILNSLGCNDAWTKVNHIYEGPAPLYINHLNLVKQAMVAQGFSTLPEWELLVWYKHQ